MEGFQYITKVKLERKKNVFWAITINWSVFTDYSADYACRSTSAPRPELGAAMKDLATPIIEMLDLPKTYLLGLDVAGVTLKRDLPNSPLGIVVTMQKKGLAFKSPIIINTPLIDEPDQNLVSLVTVLESECWQYINGRRAQMTLFDEEGDEAVNRETGEITSIIPTRAARNSRYEKH